MYVFGQEHPAVSRRALQTLPRYGILNYRLFQGYEG